MFLAQLKLNDDLIEIVIFLVVIALSILGAVAKKLITAFTPPEKRIPPPTMARTMQRTVVRRVVPPVQSRPAPGPVMQGGPSRPPVVHRPPPTRQVVIVEVDEVAEPLPPRVRPLARPMPSSEPAPTPQLTHRPKREAAPARTETRLGHLKPEVLEEEVRFEAGTKVRMTRREPTVPEKEQHFEEELGARLGYADAWTPCAEVRKPMTVLGRLSRRTIRQAVVLREILGPPMGLRPYDDPYHAL